LWEPPDLGQVGLDWQLGAFAVDPPTDNSGEVGRLVQAMAGFGGGAADSSNVVSLGADTSQQQFLTAPQPMNSTFAWLSTIGRICSSQ
jgi:hypothetical protein